MPKVRKQFILDPLKIRRVKRILKVPTETQAVDEALNLVIANNEIAEVHRKLSGRLKIKNMDQSHFNG